ncbi:hypothetical protein CAPTEDRAFT_224153 [Capitella teleta]|uniref:G-protein coupled receptors family 1 profile domain-containing protein n=1 Tax=Capitella teleta TaxID=283909 RepID=R7UUT9_CAPTE|nr:hypothetical protein CAPTEDRAFT_224153 [Capitella teleta]|eukprot:ELU09923.1 hypothetical protein CAPTEDRAFT_224153 [Capitella teleta]
MAKHRSGNSASVIASVKNAFASRYVVIVHPMKSRTWCTMGNTKKIIIGVWVIAVLLSLPVLHIMAAHAMYYYNNYTSVVVGTCSSTGGNSDEERIIIAWYQFLVLFIAPVVVMNFCYAYVIHVLWISTKELAKLTHTNRKAHKKRPLQKAVNQSCIEDESKRLTHSPNRPVTKTIITRAVKDHSLDVKEARKQVIKMLLTIIGVFFMCWGPKMILNILKVHQWQVLHKDESFYATLPINLLPYIQSCTNPLIYSFMSNNFRRSMRNACRARCHVCFRIARACTRSRQSEFDMETKSVNGTSKYSPTSVSNARAGRTIYTSVVSEC